MIDNYWVLHKGGVPRTWLIVGAVVGAVSALASVVVLVWIQGLDTADKVASVAGLLVGVAALGVAVWSVQADNGVADDATLLDRATGRLAELVRQQWDDEIGMRGLRNPQPIRVRWSTSGRPVVASAKAVLGERAGIGGRPLRLRLAGDLLEVAGTVRQLPHRQLVVLGEPGAGKTVVAMLFTLDELGRREPTDPVPVLLPLAGWDPRHEHLDSWMARRIEAEYPGLRDARRYGPGAAERLVRCGRVLPVLDGLDEMPAQLAPDAIAALNDTVGNAGIVVTCRSSNYQEIVANASATLSRAAVIEIQPVAVGDAQDYLTGSEPAALSRWEPVMATMRQDSDSVLARTLSTPFMISMARAVCAPGGTSPKELVRLAGVDSVTQLSQKLIQQYVPAIYRDRRPLPPGAPARSEYRADRVSTWLGFLAHHLQHHLNRSPNLVWWQLPVAVPAWLVGLVAGVGALAGLVMMVPWIVLVLANSQASAPAGVMAGASIVVVALAVGLTATRNTRALANQPWNPPPS